MLPRVASSSVLWQAIRSEIAFLFYFSRNYHQRFFLVKAIAIVWTSSETLLKV